MTARAPRSSAGVSGGFTLMELLVAMTLLAMLMTVLFGSLSFGARVWETSDRIHREDSEALAIRGFLRERLEQTLPMTLRRADGDDEIVFAGERTALRFASTMPESVGLGPYLMELALRPGSNPDGGNDLALRWRLVDDASSALADGVDQRVILRDIAAIALTYYGAKDQERTQPSWHATWADQPALPDLIRLEFAFLDDDQRHWPPLIVSPRIDEWYDTSF